MCEACRARDRLIRKNRQLRKLATARDNEIQTVENATVGGPDEERHEDGEDEEPSDHPEQTEPVAFSGHTQSSEVQSPLAFMNLLKPADFSAVVQLSFPVFRHVAEALL
jgi:hypothetical protein